MSNENEVIDGRAIFLGHEQAWWQLNMAGVLGRNFGWDDIAREIPELASPVIRKHVLVEGHTTRIPNLLANVRTYDDKFVGMGSDRYEVFHTFEAYELGHVLAELGELDLVSAGTLREGRQFFFTFDAGTFDVGGEQFQGNISVVGSHDGSMPVQVIYSLTVIVCANTMALAIGSAAHKYVLRHTKGIRERETLLREALGKGAHFFNHSVQLIEATQRVHVRPTQGEYLALIEQVIPISKAMIEKGGRSFTIAKKARHEIGSLFRGPLTEQHPNTGWAFIQAVNTWEQWAQTVKGGGKERTNEDVAQLRAVRQFDAMVSGSQPLTDKAYELVLA